MTTAHEPTGSEGTKAANRPVASIVKRQQWIVPVLVILLLIGAFSIYARSLQTSPRGPLLATVNGEPIYQDDIDNTLRLLPSSYQTPEYRRAILNQTIDKTLLIQEAQARGIIITDHDIDLRIGRILNDTGRSPQELRVALSEQNITPEQYRQVIKDSLYIERVGEEAVVSKISVSEADIQTYYQTHESEFLVPPKGVRVSRILVKSESFARSLIAQLDSGASFRELAMQYSMDDASGSNGGSIGVVLPNSSYPGPFLSASRSLDQNQYTRVPVHSEAGYDVILRNFDVEPFQQVRDRIHDRLLLQQQRDAFVSFLAALRARADIKFYQGGGVISTSGNHALDGFASCVAKQSTLYVTSWSESSNKQLALFGTSEGALTKVDCGMQVTLCSQANIQKYPTWVIAGTQYGALTLEELAEKTACKKPKSA